MIECLRSSCLPPRASAIGRAAFLAVVVAACGEAPGPPAGGEGGAEHPELRALVDSLLPALETASGLPATSAVRVERRSSEQVRAFVESQLEDEMPAERMEGVRASYALLGLIPDTLDLRSLLLDLYTEQIVGYYDPDTETLYAVDQVSRAALRPVLAHELVHALQDQHANLDSLISPRRGNDRQIAAQAALEGHATLVMFGLLASEATGQPVDPATMPNPAEQLRAGMEEQNRDFPVFARAPRAIREMLLFPYAGGAAFVQALWQAGNANGERVVPLGENLPQSTEQVLDPAGAFLATRDAPTELRFTADTAWSVAYENTLGAFETGLFLERHSGSGGASGWDGDRFRLLDSPSGPHALEWVSIWDDAASADAFAAAARAALESTSLSADGLVSTGLLEERPIVRIVLAGAGLDPATVPVSELYCADEAGAPTACSAASGAAGDTTDR